jgi:signal transduction histidine kinase
LRVNVVLDLDPTLAPVPMSPLDIGRVVLNVAENAAYAMRDRLRSTPRGYVPELVVTTTTRPTGAELRVRDNGAGIPTGAIDRVFEPFFTTKPPGSGTGLGLSLSREIIVQGHQGTMTVSSEEGAWTEVVITLPHGTPTRPPPRT